MELEEVARVQEFMDKVNPALNELRQDVIKHIDRLVGTDTLVHSSSEPPDELKQWARSVPSNWDLADASPRPAPPPVLRHSRHHSTNGDDARLPTLSTALSLRDGNAFADPLAKAFEVFEARVKCVASSLAAHAVRLEVEACELEEALNNRERAPKRTSSDAGLSSDMDPCVSAPTDESGVGVHDESGSGDVASDESSLDLPDDEHHLPRGVPGARSTKRRWSEGDEASIYWDATADSFTDSVKSVRDFDNVVAAALQTAPVVHDLSSSSAAGVLRSNSRLGRFKSSSGPIAGAFESFSQAKAPVTAARRTALPNPAPESMGISLWGILKSAIGKDLTKITLPATINEPLSGLQRLSEDMEHAALLEKAGATQSLEGRMLYVTLFAAIGVNSQIARYRKPFNPLLGETFEWHSQDGKHHLLAEQVSHHPPIACLASKGPSYMYRAEVQLVSSFWGKSIQLKSKGGVSVSLPDWDETFAWPKPKFTINNIILGKPWIEASGHISVEASNGCHADITYPACKGRLNKRGEISGKVWSADGTLAFELSGNTMSEVRTTPMSASAAALLNAQVGQPVTVYSRPATDPKLYSYYNMTPFAIELNDDASHVLLQIAPTDSRYRPDMRLLEQAEYETSTIEKLRLEQKQREAAAARKAKGRQYKPLWFEFDPSLDALVKDEGLAAPFVWSFNDLYWTRQKQADWSACPDLY